MPKKENSGVLRSKDSRILGCFMVLTLTVNTLLGYGEQYVAIVCTSGVSFGAENAHIGKQFPIRTLSAQRYFSTDNNTTELIIKISRTPYGVPAFP